MQKKKNIKSCEIKTEKVQSVRSTGGAAANLQIIRLLKGDIFETQNI